MPSKGASPFKIGLIRWGTGSARVSHHSLSGACPGHPTCPGPCSAPCHRVTRRNTRPLSARGPRQSVPGGPAPAAGLLPHPWGTASPVTPGDETPPGPLRAKIRVVTVPSERVRKLETRNRHGREAGINREREKRGLLPAAAPLVPEPQPHGPAATRPSVVPQRPPVAAPGRSGDGQTDRPSVRLPRLPLGPWGHRCGDEMENRAGKGRERERWGYASAQSLRPPLGAAGEIQGPHWVPFGST